MILCRGRSSSYEASPPTKSPSHPVPPTKSQGLRGKEDFGVKIIFIIELTKKKSAYAFKMILLEEEKF